MIHQALVFEETSTSSAQAASNTKDRTELLISRLVRYHWDRHHLEAIKTEYKARYGKELLAAVSEGTKGDFGDFCTELVLRRGTAAGGSGSGGGGGGGR